MHSSETAQVFFDNVRIPPAQPYRPRRRGLHDADAAIPGERLFGAANMIKGLEYCIDSTIEHCKERQTFGKALIDNQVIHFRLAELATEIECLRALVYQATEQYIKGQDVTRLASMAKLKAGRLGREVSDSCLEYWAGTGLYVGQPRCPCLSRCASGIDWRRCRRNHAGNHLQIDGHATGEKTMSTFAAGSPITARCTSPSIGLERRNAMSLEMVHELCIGSGPNSTTKSARWF